MSSIAAVQALMVGLFLAVQWKLPLMIWWRRLPSYSGDRLVSPPRPLPGKFVSKRGEDVLL